MYDMLVVQSNGRLTPLTPVSPQGGHHPTDLSPRSARSTSSSLMSDSPTSSSPTPIKDFHSQLHHHQLLQDGRGGPEDFSALQRLQYALERNSLFSNLNRFQNGQNGNKSPNRDLEMEKRHEYENELGSPKPMIMENLNNSLEDFDKGSTDSSSNLTEMPNQSPNANPINIFQCPLCSIVCNGRHSFNEHLVTHTQQHVCPKCDYLTTTEENLRDHLQESHDLTDPDCLSDDDVRVPKMNSQGKMKTFKCKQCQHVSITKIEFWAHSKSHIRQEKMLTCPKCEFVTEYKHHLEYHLRNHFGSKPFQCTECSYSCVNKSMLNSHLKSHSNIYQYGCANCPYVTKYCHSLKLHLRKYNHNPSAVLNPDGSQNPLTIIDVYGTRRGPKNKKPPSTPTSDTLAQIQSQVSPHSNDDGNETDREDDYDQNSQPSPNLKNEMNNMNPQLNRLSNDMNDYMSDGELNHPLAIPMSDTIRNNFSPLQSPMIHIGDTKAILEQIAAKSPLEFYAAALNQYFFTNPMIHMQPVQDLAKMVAKEQQDQFLAHIFAATQAQVQNGIIGIPGNLEIEMQANQGPLDLRQPQQPVNARNGNSKLETEKHGVRSQDYDDIKKRKRKGKAHRIDRQVAEDLRIKDEEVLDFSNNNHHSRVQQKELNLICKYCEISFLDQVLYSMHMSYHSGDADPFLCKSCGRKTANKIAFSVHLTTDPH